MIGKSYETAQTIDADAMADPQFLEESWTIGVTAALWNRRHRVQQQAAQQTVQQQARPYVELDSDFFARLRQWDAQQSATVADTKSDTETAQTDADWERFNTARESRRPLNTPSKMNASLAYRLLDVTAMSSREQIRSAYRRMVGQWHPDRIANSSEEMRRQANEHMIAINLAYRLLCEDQLKKAA
jgi:DnaJ-domain-containing protein 1